MLHQAHARCTHGFTRPPACAHTQAYTGLRTLYLESNAISVLQGLDALVNLRSLYLGKNLLATLERGLGRLTTLQTLDVSDNALASLDGVARLPQLRTLLAAGNRLAAADGIRELSVCAELVSLDLSANRLSGGDALALVTALPLALLKLQGNPLVSSTP